MKPYVAVIAMVNGMIGGLILVLPILAMQGGSLLSFFVITITGFFSFYSCYLCVIHLGEHEDLDKALVHHFGGSRFVKIFYDILVCVNLVFLLLLYYNLIVQQWQGLLPYNVANPICNAFALVLLTFALNYFHLGAQILGYGIVSIMGYCVFLIWLVASAPSGPNTIPLFGTGAVNLAASMGQAFAIQTFFIPVLRQLPDTKNYAKYTLIAYAIGATTYLYIAYTGSYGIINRPQVIFPLQTIQNYFEQGNWQVAIVEVLYLIHLYSAFGQFLLVAKKRCFGVFNLQQSTPKHFMTIPEIIFTVLVVGLCTGIFFAGISIDNLIEINGAIIGFFFIYLLPALMHAKCLYLPKKVKMTEQAMLENDQKMGTIQLQQYTKSNKGQETKIQDITQLQRHLSKMSKLSQQNQQNPQNKIQPQNNNQQNLTNNKKNNDNSDNDDNKQATGQQQTQNNDNTEAKNIDYTCKCKKPKTMLQVIDILSLVGMVGLGGFIMVDGFITVITQ